MKPIRLSELMQRFAQPLVILLIEGNEAKAKLGGGLGHGTIRQELDEARNHAEWSWNRNFGKRSSLDFVA
jgi:hypothetical protein